jgi:hypothetical protein
MPIIEFPQKPSTNEPPFFSDIKKEGYHVFSLKNAKIPGYYPNKFPDYPGVNLSDLTIGDTITIRVFFRVGTGEEDIRADGGYIDLDVEFIEEDKVMANITTLLPKNFPLGTGTSLEVFEEEILYKGGQFKVH